MPVPTSINDLSTTAASNSPTGADSPSTLDDHIRALASFIASLRDDKADSADAVLLTGNQTIAGTKTFSSTIAGSITGNSATATKLATARTIGGVSFDGSANINLPGVNSVGNQATTGNASTATKLSTASGSAPSYSARAWVNFLGTGTVNIRASGNVSSITDLGPGLYRVNFSTAMEDTDYCVLATGRAGSGVKLTDNSEFQARSTSNCTVTANDDNGVNAADVVWANVAIFR